MVTFQQIAQAIVSATDEELQMVRAYFQKMSEDSTSSQDHSCEQTQQRLQ